MLPTFRLRFRKPAFQFSIHQSNTRVRLGKATSSNRVACGQLRLGCFAGRVRRRALVFLIISSLLIWPGALGVRGLAARAYTGVEFSGGLVGYLPLIMKALLWFVATPQRPQTLADRNGAVASVRVSPHKLVGYVGDHVTFTGMGIGADRQPAHGAKFDWESSDTSKLEIDEAGHATLRQPGLVRVTCRTANASQSAPVLIRPTRRRLQTDNEWRADQDSLSDAATGPSGFLDALPSLLNKVAPTANAQGNSPGDFPNATWLTHVGTPAFTALEDTRLGPVMPGSNFELPIPLVSLGGRGMATSLTAYYNSNQWGAYSGQGGTTYVFDPIQSWPSPGFSLGFGRIVYYNGYVDGNLVSWHSFMLIEPNGTRRSLGVGTDYGSNTLQTTDGSHITYVGNAADGGTLFYNDGTTVTIGKVNNRLLPTQITDTNGNYIQVAYKWETNFPGIAINYIVDTLGRVISFNYGEWPAPPGSTRLTSIRTPTGGVTFGYQTVTMNHNFQNEIIVENAPASFPAISSVTIPQRPTYQFSYSGYGMIYNISLASAGGNATVTYNYPLGGEELYGGPTFTQRTESPNSVYSYASWGEVTRPDGTKLSVSPSIRELKNTSAQTLSKTEYAFTTDPGGSTGVQSVVGTNEAGQQTRVDFDYDAFGNILNMREFGFKVSGVWQVRRRTHYSYVNWEPYLSAYIRDRVTEVSVYDALQNTNDADDVLICKTVLAYDAPVGGMEGYGGAANPPGHLSSYDTTKTARGNLTGVTKYSDVVSGTSVTQSSKRDIFGGVTLAQVACCDQKSFTMTQATYWSKPSQTTSGDMSGIYLISSASYNFNTLSEISATDPDNQITAYNYDPWGNQTYQNSPTGVTVSSSFSAWSDPASATVAYTEGGLNKTITTSQVYDGWGQMTSAIEENGGQTNYTYDNMGRLLSQTNRFPQGGTPGPASTFQYDQLGRMTRVTLPDGNYTQTDFGPSTVTTTDQVNRKIKRENDGLGRLIKVTEQDVATGALTRETTYLYDAADRLIQVTQGGQTRAFKYDAEGRLLFERSPEMSATINDGTGTYWSTKYTYTSFGAMATKTDSRGVITTQGYDTLNRLTSISYNTSGAPGVATTPGVTYNYDNNPASNTKGLLLSVSLGTSYSETYAYSVGGGGNGGNQISPASVTRTIEGRNYTTSLQLNALTQVTQLTFPSGRVVNAGYDARARLSSIANSGGPTYISSIAYDVNGTSTGWTLGNGVREAFGFSANRLQPTLHTAGTISPYKNIMNVSYGYQASAGQMGAGSTAGNAGQLINFSGTLGGATESGGYTYDDLGRIVTANQTSNASSAQRRYSYDRWGNRTGVWDATSGGNQIQSVTLQQSGGAPTNRVQSVTAGMTLNYTYDASGDVTNDGAHTYTYDAVNRIVSIDGGLTGQYSYDHQNRRVKKLSNGATTHYVWERGQVLAEHNGSTGAVIMDYVHFGNKLIAKVTSGSTQYILSDRMSGRLVLDTSGTVLGRQGHLPFGEDFGESGLQEKHHLTSYERDDETGNDYAVNRGYSPSIGRFLSADPYVASESAADPRGWNRYSYTRNVVINRGDPLGLQDGPIEGDCPPAGTQGTWPGRCLCQTAPQACYRRYGPPNVDGQGRGPGGGQRVCPIEPLNPVTDPEARAFEDNPNRVDVNHLTPAMRTAVDCFQSAVVNVGGTFNITSAWRPETYQRHLREVWDKYTALLNNNSAECRATREAVTTEFNRHSLIPNQGARPAVHSDHTRGIAIDVVIQGLPRDADVDDLGGRCHLRRTVAGDPVHWVLQ
ncbi:MAG: RHS repeat-associated core domain-containing protein [Acidobacteriota bacterium]